MPQYFDFSRLIEKYMTEFTAITLSDGIWDAKGDWKDVQTNIQTLQGAIIAFSDTKIYRSEGTLTAKDRQLFMLEPLDDKLIGAKVVYKGDEYSVETCSENAEFTGVYNYTLKYISAFREENPDYEVADEFVEFEQRLDGVLVD